MRLSKARSKEQGKEDQAKKAAGAQGASNFAEHRPGKHEIRQVLQGRFAHVHTIGCLQFFA